MLTEISSFLLFIRSHTVFAHFFCFSSVRRYDPYPFHVTYLIWGFLLLFLLFWRIFISFSSCAIKINIFALIKTPIKRGPAVLPILRLSHEKVYPISPLKGVFFVYYFLLLLIFCFWFFSVLFQLRSLSPDVSDWPANGLRSASQILYWLYVQWWGIILYYIILYYIILYYIMLYIIIYGYKHSPYITPSY